VDTYRFYRIVEPSKLPSVAETHDCTNDLAALDKGLELCADGDIEVWIGARYVAYFKKRTTASFEDASPANRDATPA
jgi:hypothetical protein